jgi:glycosyltransferase involved in cell wall biosynthesis
MNSQTFKIRPTLSIIIPTYNRAQQIHGTLSSIRSALGAEHSNAIHVILVDNNSNASNRDHYRDLVSKLSDFISIEYLLETLQGRSNACNSGVIHCHSKWVAFIDDDETVSLNWIKTALHLLQLGQFSYFGGHVLPDWEAPPPPWLPIHRGQFRGVLGWIELSDTNRSYDDFDASLCGGNMIVNREMYLNIGGFSSSLGRGSNNLLGGEDGEFHRRLKRAGAKGLYCPELSVHHWVPTSRMTINYHQRWAYWSGASNRIRIITQPQTAEILPHIFAVPRYRFAKGLKGFGRCIFEALSGRLRKQPDGVIGLLNFMYLIGLLRGKAEGEKLGLSMKPSETSR